MPAGDPVNNAPRAIRSCKPATEGIALRQRQLFPWLCTFNAAFFFFLIWRGPSKWSTKSELFASYLKARSQYLLQGIPCSGEALLVVGSRLLTHAPYKIRG